MFAFVAKGNIKDTAIPGWLASGDAEQFIPEVLKMQCDALATKFETWSVLRDQRPTSKNGLGAVRKVCTSLILEGLRKSRSIFISITTNVPIC